MKRNLPTFSKAQYFPIKESWRKLKNVFQSEDATKIWKACMKEYSEMRAEQYGYQHKERLTPTSPSYYDSCDWRWNRPGKKPAFWDYACHSACHWVADLALFVAKTCYPSESWRIVTSQKHSTVWNGDRKNPVLFDINFSALGVPPKEALQLACLGREMRVGTYMKGYLHHSP